MRKTMKDKKYNKDRGSITLYVLISMLFFLIVVVGIYINVSNMKQKQEKEVKQIQERYKQEQKLDTIYEQSYKNYISVSTPTLEVYSGEINSENSELKGKAIGKNDNSMTTIYTSAEKNHVKFSGGKNDEKYLYSYMKDGKLTEISANEIEITATETGITIYTYLKDEKGNAGKFYTAITVKFTKLEDKTIYVAKENTIKIGKIEGNSNIGEITFGNVGDEKVISLNGDEITGLNGGTTTLIATESNGGAKATITVKVVEIKLAENRGTTCVGVNKIVSIAEIINVEGAGTLKVESSDDTIAAVSMENNKFTIVPKKTGIVTIKITESKLGATATYELKIANVTLTPNGGKYTMPTEGNATIKTDVIVENAEKVEVCWSNQSSWSVIDSKKTVSNENCTEGEYYLKVRINDDFIYTSNVFIVGKNTEDENKITISLSNTSLTNQEITATVKYGSTLTANKKAGYGENITIAKSVVSEATATQIKVKKNGYIYAEATDAAGNKVTASLQITNIDNLPPKAFAITTGTVTTSSIAVTVSTTDADATNTSAKTGIAGYRFSKDDGKTWSGYQTSGEYKFSDLIGAVSGVTYKIKVEAKDNVGNTTVTSKDIATIKDDDYYVATANKLLETIGGRNFYKTNSSPAIAGMMYITTSRNWTVPIMVSTDSSAVNMYTSYNNQNLGTAGNLVYKGVTFYYSTTGQWMGEASYTSPLVTLNDSSSRFSTMSEAATNLLDRYFYSTKQKNYEVFYNANGGSGAPGVQKKIKGQNLTLSGTNPTRSGYTFKGWASTNNSTNAEYTAGGNYANNESKILYAVWKDEVAPSVPTIKYNSGENAHRWQNNINITLSSTDEVSGILNYEIDWTGDGNANGTTDSNFIPWNGYNSCNTRFRAVDNAGNKSAWSSKCDIHMDTTAPTSTNIRIENVTTTGYDVYIDGVSDNASGVNRIQFPTWTSSGGQDDIQSNWGSNSSASGTNKGNGVYYYRVNVTDHKNEYGTYNTHVYAYDNAGNSTNIRVATVTVPGVTITYNYNYSGAPQSATATKGYNSQLGSLSSPTRTGYTFAGWYTAASGGNQISASTRTPASNTTYYAHWTINQYTLTVNPGGSTYKQNYASTKSVSAPSQSYTVSYNGNGGTSPSAQSASRNLSSWSLSGSGTINSNSANPTTYTYGAGNGTLTANYNGTANAIKLPSSSRTGYSFGGWYDAASGGNKIGDAGANYSPTKSLTLYAHWVDNIAPTNVKLTADTTKPTNKTVNFTVTATEQGSGIENYTFYTKNKYINSSGDSKTSTDENTTGKLTKTVEFGLIEVYAVVKDKANNATQSNTITIYDFNIDNETELNAFKYSVNTANDMNFKTTTITQRNDITMTSSWTEGISKDESHGFMGTYNGNGKTISNLNITGSNNIIGLFGYVNTSVAVIKNVNIKNPYINGQYDVGGIVGYNKGTISNCNLTYGNATSSKGVWRCS